VVSRRPAAKSNPNATAAASANIFCRSIGYSRCSIAESGFFAAVVDPANQLHKFGREPREEHLQIGDRGARFVFLDQCVVGVVLETDGCGLFSLECDDLLQPRLKLREVVLAFAVCHAC